MVDLKLGDGEFHKLHISTAESLFDYNASIQHLPRVTCKSLKWHDMNVTTFANYLKMTEYANRPIFAQTLCRFVLPQCGDFYSGLGVRAFETGAISRVGIINQVEPSDK